MVQTVTHAGLVNNLTEGVLTHDVLMKHIIAVYSSALSGVLRMLGIICSSFAQLQEGLHCESVPVLPSCELGLEAIAHELCHGQTRKVMA